MNISKRAPQTTILWIGLRYALALFAVVAATALPSAAQTWTIEVEIGVAPFQEKGYSLASTSDGGAIGIGPALQSDGYWHIAVVRLDPLGNIIWSYVYDTWAFEDTFEKNEFSIIETTSLDIVWTTSVNYPTIPTRDVIVARTDNFGNLIWAITYGSPDLDDFGASVIETASGDLAVTGTSCDPSQNNTCDVLLFRLDAGGNLLWGFRYDNQAIDVGRCVREDFDGSLVVAGETVCSGGSGVCRAALMLKTDAGGNLLWIWHYGQDVLSGFSTVAIGSTGDYFACGLTATNPAADGYIARIDRGSGALHYAAKYDLHGAYDAFWHIAPGYTGDTFVLTGEATDSTGTRRIIALEVHELLGLPLWTRLYSPAGEAAAGRCITQSPSNPATDAGYWIFGWLERDPNEQQMYALRIGNVSGTTDCSECVTLNGEFSADAVEVTATQTWYDEWIPVSTEPIEILFQDLVCTGLYIEPAECPPPPDPFVCPDTCYWTLQGNVGTDPTANYLGTSDNTDLSIRTNAVEHVRIVATTGNVGINESNPRNTLDVSGNSVIGSTFAGTVVAPANSLLVQNELGAGYAANPGAYTLYVNGPGWALGGWFGSDRRWKRNVNAIDDALTKVLQLRGVSYDFNREDYPNLRFPQDRRLGFIAQELEQVVPEVVTINNDGYKGVAYHELTALLVESTKQQQQLIEELQSANAQLIVQIEELRRLVAKDPTTDIDIEDNSSQFRLGNKSSARLGANDPNPFSESTEISYYLPQTARRAELVVYRISSGAEAGRFALSQRGNGSIRIDARNFESGAYMYALMVDGTAADRGEMVIVK